MFDEINNKEQNEEMEFPWLIFKLKDNLYTVNSKMITSIVITPENITYVPNVPKYINGLIHLRGNVIPLIDLRVLFNMKSIKEELEESKNLSEQNETNNNKNDNDNEKEMVVVLENDNTFVGIMVDEVLSVDNIIPFEETEEIKKINKSNYIKGVAKGEKSNDILLILDEDKLMNLA